MVATEEEPDVSPVPDPVQIRQQLERLVLDEHLRSSRRSVTFLRYIVEETLHGRADEIKERTIGVNVFGRPLTYDTNSDHVVRTAASELRRRIALYYGKDEHRDELRILLTPGSYAPQFGHAKGAGRDRRREEPPGPDAEPPTLSEPAPSTGLPSGSPAAMVAAVTPWTRNRALWVSVASLLLIVGLAVGRAHSAAERSVTAEKLFWKPLLDSDGPVLIAVGDVPHGPPVVSSNAGLPSVTPAAPGPPTLPFADAVTIARISGVLAANGKEFVIRREGLSSFADLRERPTVLVGAFNNEWSLRLTRNLRFSLALDSGRRLLYIRDRDHPDERAWQWSIDPHPTEKDRASTTPLHDYTLISRVLDSETGHDVVVLGGLYTYGTQAAGEYVSSPQMMALPRDVLEGAHGKTLQIVLETLVTDGSAGPPRVVAVHEE